MIQDDGQMDIFVDGERSIINFNSITGVCERNIDVQIGARKFFNGGADGYFGGEMDEVRTSRVSRYQDNFEPGTLPFVADLDTISLYNFNGDFNDSSSLGHHAIQVGNVRFVKSTLPKEGSTPTSGNSFPVIATRNLPKGQVAVVYDAVISGSDLDIGDNLTMTISDLPPGIIYSCDGGTSQISCTLSGIPTLKGNFRVLVVLSDGAGGSDQKTLNLQIK